MVTETADDLYQRVARIEAHLEHLATKADLADLRTEIAELRGSMKMMFIGLAVLNTTVSIGVGVVLRLWPGG